MVRTGRQAIAAVIVICAVIAGLVYLATIPVTEPDGTVDPKESVVDPS